jgi:8-amino-7-oxononanoate synthase
MLKRKLSDYTEHKRALGLKRTLKRIPRHALNFSSNDYLGLAHNQTLKRAYHEGLERYPIGSTSSMLISGYHESHHALQQAFIHALDVDAALLFSSGYSANLSLMRLLAELKFHALIDKQVHASIYDGLQLGGGAYSRYRHQDEMHFKQQQHKLPPDAVIITESLFSMSGHMPNLARLATSHALLVDEAHAFGLYGPDGLGCVKAHHLTQDNVPLRVIPFGKALGASGAVIAGDKVWIDALVQAARPLIYSTAMSPAIAYGIREALTLLRRADPARETLQHNIRIFREHIQHSPLTWRDSMSPIQQLKLGCPIKALHYSAKLQEKNIICLPIREPTVTGPDTGLRVVLNSTHTTDDINHLFESFHACQLSI